MSLCRHAYSSMTVRVSCHDDLLSEECRQYDQRSAWTCARPACLEKTIKWVKASGNQPVFHAKGGQKLSREELAAL